jgi:hypothetical protein
MPLSPSAIVRRFFAQADAWHNLSYEMLDQAKTVRARKYLDRAEAAALKAKELGYPDLGGILSEIRNTKRQANAYELDPYRRGTGSTLLDLV